jgi:hypothetical protein
MSDPHLYEAEIENLKAQLADAILRSDEYESMLLAIKNVLQQDLEIKIGPYIISQSRNNRSDKIWIGHESGEGGEMGLESFEKIYNEWF